MVKKFALTGGPCAGKTTASAYLSEKLMDRGFLPLFVPETATLMMLGNVKTSSGFFKLRTFQKSVLDSLVHLERIFEDAAGACEHPKPVLICDRGIPDAKAYMPAEMYRDLLKELGLGSEVEVRDRRYEAVFHLRTAAYGAESFYTTDNNKVRLENTIEAARESDDKTLRMWNGHPHLRIIDNSTDFAGKLKRLDQAVCSALGVPVPLEIERKYVCAPVDIDAMPVPVQKIEIEQVYIEPGETRVRKRGQHGSYVYYFTEKHEVRPGVRIETERFITAQEYEAAKRRMREDTRPIQKIRNCFVYENQYFELDVINLSAPLYLLEVELTEENQTVKLPPFIKVLRDVTNDKDFTNFSLAKDPLKLRQLNDDD